MNRSIWLKKKKNVVTSEFGIETTSCRVKKTRVVLRVRTPKYISDLKIVKFPTTYRRPHFRLDVTGPKLIVLPSNGNTLYENRRKRSVLAAQCAKTKRKIRKKLRFFSVVFVMISFLNLYNVAAAPEYLCVQSIDNARTGRSRMKKP